MAATDTAARAIALLEVCPHCAGQGKLPASDKPRAKVVECAHCDGTGNYDAARLMRAWEAGRSAITDRLDGMILQVQDAISDGEHAERPKPEQLRRLAG